MMRRYFIIIVAAYLTSSCGGDTVASKTEFEVIPESPVLIQTDFSYTKPPLSAEDEPETVVIGGAWFKLGFKFTNSSSEQVTVISIKFQATGISPEGAEVSSESIVDTGDLPQNQNADLGDDQLYLFTTVQGGQSFSEQFTSGIYLHSFPKIPDVVSSNLQVTATIQGWVGTPEVPKETFEKVIVFSTQ
jgi:hypothetical protein